MWRNTGLCLGLGRQFCLPIEEQIKLFKRYCFDSFFIYWDYIDDLNALKRYSEEYEMGIQFIHAPYGRARELWTADSAEAVGELIDCLRDCARIGVDLAVFHSIIGREMHSPNGYGVESFTRVVDEAERLGIRIAFENIEGEEYLSMIMEAFADRKHVGFCWDSGHEQCYNESKDMLALYGDRLMCVHLNDNLGTEDIHILPFDGIIDWEDTAKRLNRHGYAGPLTFELKTLTYPYRMETGEHDYDDIRRFLSTAYMRACKIAALMDRDRKANYNI